MMVKNVERLPPEAFARGIKRLHQRRKSKNVLILGFDTEYDSKSQEIVSYQLSDGVWEHSELLEATVDIKPHELVEWVIACAQKWGYKARNINTYCLVSHFSSAELSHIDGFEEAGTVRRVSAAQVYNWSYRINQHTNLLVMDNYHFWNTGNNGNASLAAVSEKFGEKKLEYDTRNVTRESLKDPKFREYALWDAVVCARVFKKFRDRLWEDHSVDVMQYCTPASLAMAVYRQHFQGEDYAAPEPKIRRQAWLSLWGGRAEAYVQGDIEGDWSLRDVVSLYPTSERILGIMPRAEDWYMPSEPKTWRGICRVKFEFPKSVKYPCLPVCHDGRLQFPRRGVSDCTLDEAKVAQKLGAELSFLKICEYDTGSDALTRFMEHFAREKTTAEEEGYLVDNEWRKCDHVGACECEMRDAVGRELSKLMMNSLIGKLSQNRGEVDIEALKKFALEVDIPLSVVTNPNFLHPDKPKSTPRIGGHIMPEWSALILGKARSIMACLLNDVGLSLICSTDSLLIPSRLNWLVDERMKEYGVTLTNKNKGLTTHRIRVVRNRVYAATSKEGKLIFGASHAIHLGQKNRSCESCRKNECAEPTHNAWRFIMSDETEYEKVKRFGLKTAIRLGKRFFGEEEALQRMKFLRLWDNKRRLLADGTTVPWEDTAEYDRALSKKIVSNPFALTMEIE